MDILASDFLASVDRVSRSGFAQGRAAGLQRAYTLAVSAVNSQSDPVVVEALRRLADNIYKEARKHD